jgi:hypothetical protein
VGLKASAYTSGASQYVKSDDVKAGPQSFTIKSIEAAETPDGKPALQLAFEGGKKLTLNKTNARVLASMLGDDTDAWVAKKIVASFDPTVMYAGKMIGGIRVRPASSPATPSIE